MDITKKIIIGILLFLSAIVGPSVVRIIFAIFNLTDSVPNIVFLILCGVVGFIWGVIVAKVFKIDKK